MKRALAGILLGLALPLVAGAEGKTIAQPPDHPYGALADGSGAQLTESVTPWTTS